VSLGLRRLVRIAAGYALAALFASLFLNLAVPVSATWPEPRLFFSPGEFFLHSAFAAMVIAGLALLPALLFILVAEWRRQTRFSFFMVAGAASALLPLAALDLFRGAAEPPAGDTLTTLLALAGAMAGLVYWLVAGRFSGTNAASLTAPAQTGS
jgi:hypothetical protein